MTRRTSLSGVSTLADVAGGGLAPSLVGFDPVFGNLARHSGLADAELQLATGHARRETLAVYQHVALDGDLVGPHEVCCS